MAVLHVAAGGQSVRGIDCGGFGLTCAIAVALQAEWMQVALLHFSSEAFMAVSEQAMEKRLIVAEQAMVATSRGTSTVMMYLTLLPVRTEVSGLGERR